jgi:hypothetical protein
MNKPIFCQVRVKGHLDESWIEWFEGMAITNEAGGDALLTGYLADQAALHGLLNRISSLGLNLISVNTSILDDSKGS